MKRPFTQLVLQTQKTCKKIPHYLYVLMTASQKQTAHPIKFIEWALMNKKNIFVSFLPVLFGVFASSFVYLSGVPHIVEKYDLFSMNDLLKSRNIKLAGLFIVVFITIHLAIISIQYIYRLYKRNMHLNKSAENFCLIEDEIVKTSKFNLRLRKFIAELNSFLLIKKIIDEGRLDDKNQSKKRILLLQ